jgi:hypothetical protein
LGTAIVSVSLTPSESATEAKSLVMMKTLTKIECYTKARTEKTTMKSEGVKPWLEK